MKDRAPPDRGACAIGRICESFRIEPLKPRLTAVAEGLSGGGVVDVAVLGQFKAGKSSFLNSLIGAEVLPVGVLPATAVVTRIGHGPVDRAAVRYHSGAAEEIPPERLAEFVTEQGNPGNEKQVGIVDVEIASLEPYPGIRFVDTPGLGSVFAHNTQVSRDWLPRVGGALVAVSVSHPLSEQDLGLLAEVFTHTPETAILLTKADLVSESQLEAVVDFTRRQVARRTGRELPVFPFSIAPGFGALRERVRDHLLRRIVAGRKERFAEIMDHKVRGLAAECRSYLRLALAAAEAAERARGDLLEALGRERREIGAIRSEAGLHVRNLKAAVRTAAGERFFALHTEVTGRLEGALHEESRRWRGNLAKTTRAFQEWLSAALKEELSRVSPQGGACLSDHLDEAVASIHRTVRAFQDRLAKEIEGALGLAFEGARFHAEVADPARPDIRVGKTFDTQIELLWFLIPMRVFRPLVFRRFRKLIPWEAEKNLSRLAAQWAGAVNDSIDDLSRQALGFIRDELATVERLAEGAGGDRREEIRRALAELDALESASTCG
jgi:GTP-binding protein EngB required for normal cell division